MKDDKTNMEFEFKDEYWLEAKKLLEKEEKKRRFIFWFSGICLASIALALFATNGNNNHELNQKPSLPVEKTTNSNSYASSKNYDEKENTNLIYKDNQEKSQPNAVNHTHEIDNTIIIEYQPARIDNTSSIAPTTVDSTSLLGIEINHKINLTNIENPLLGKTIDSTKKIKTIKGNFSIIAGAQIHQSFLQENLSNSNFIGGKAGFNYQKFVKENVFISVGLTFNTYRNLFKKEISDIRNDQIQKLDITPANANTNNSGNGSGVIITKDEINSNNTYSIAGITYKATDIVARKEQTTKEYMYAGSISLPISIGVKVQRFSLQLGLTEEFLLYNKINEKSNLFINTTHLTKSESAAYNDFSETPRWLTFATVGVDFNLNNHFKIGLEAKKMIHNKYKNTMQSCAIIKYNF